MSENTCSRKRDWWGVNEHIAHRIGYEDGNAVNYAASINERHEDLPEFLLLLEEHVTEEHHGRLLFNLLLKGGIGLVRGFLEVIARQAEAENTSSRNLDISGDREDGITSSRNLYSTQPDKGRAKGYAPWKPQKKTRILISQVEAILREYRAELPLTARQIFYRLVGAYGYPKTEKAYESLTNHLNRARRARIIAFDDIRDDGASVMREHHYADENDFYRHVREQGETYERDKLARQKVDIRVYCESAGMMPQLRRVTRRYSVPVYSCSGFDSLTAKFDLAESVAEAHTYRGHNTVILHLGDHDPSGETIFDSIAADVHAFLEVDIPHIPGGQIARFEPVALTPDQIIQYALPTDPAKASSHSAKWGSKRACQLEALEPRVLAFILKDAIERHLDPDILAADMKAETQERRRIAAALPSGAGPIALGG